MVGVNIDLKRWGYAMRSVVFVSILILHFGVGFSAPKNAHIPFEYVMEKGQKKINFQQFTEPGKSFYKIPLHDGDLTVFIGANTFKKLVNPYPSNLNALKFMKDNAAILEGSLFFLASNDSESHPSFTVRNLVMDVATTAKDVFIRRKRTKTGDHTKIAVGQVFYVMAKRQDGFILFNNSQRIRQAQNENKGIPILKIGLDYTNNNGVIMHRQLGLSFKEGNSHAHESGYDSELYDLHTSESDMYWDFGNGKKYVIAGLEKFDARLEIPLVLQIESDEVIRLSLDLVENIKQAVYLYDKVTHKKVRLSNLGVSLNIAKGMYTDRFYIGFQSRLVAVTKELDHQMQVSY